MSHDCKQKGLGKPQVMGSVCCRPSARCPRSPSPVYAEVQGVHSSKELEKDPEDAGHLLSPPPPQSWEELLPLSPIAASSQGRVSSLDDPRGVGGRPGPSGTKVNQGLRIGFFSSSPSSLSPLLSGPAGHPRFSWISGKWGELRLAVAPGIPGPGWVTFVQGQPCPPNSGQ